VLDDGLEARLQAGALLLQPGGGDAVARARGARRAVARLLVGAELRTPFDAVRHVAGKLGDFARRATGRRDLRETFILNALVGLDLAVWKLFAAARGTEDLDDLLPEDFRQVLPARHSRVARVPLVDYGMPPAEAAALADDGCVLLKIKIGGPGDRKTMLAADMARLSELHDALRDRKPEGAPGGRVMYYLDANGRYESGDTLLRLLDHADRIGMLERIALLEEPYPENADIAVDALPVRVAADESVHGPADVRARADMGYGAFAIKPAGKTLSVSLEGVREAAARGIPCFVADSACVPLLAEWNKCVACRLPALPGIGCGVLESNGREHYAAWDRLTAEHAVPGAPWMTPRRGFFETGEPFYRVSGGIFREWKSYERLLPAEPFSAAG